jgi:RNA polymerase sigma-70 factor (ECF subfamily)
VILSEDPAKLYLVARRTRDEELQRVYRSNLDAVFAFFSYSVPRHTAEDLTALTFERVVKHWARFDSAKASERTWILAIARNALTDHWRRQAHRRATSLDEYPLLAGRLAASDDPIAERLAAQSFRDWLVGLGDREREVLALRFGADLSAADIARSMELTEGNVHQIVSRSLKKLRNKARDADRESDAKRR